jgi:hypothetical protein
MFPESHHTHVQAYPQDPSMTSGGFYKVTQLNPPWQLFTCYNKSCAHATRKSLRFLCSKFTTTGTTKNELRSDEIPCANPLVASILQL